VQLQKSKKFSIEIKLDRLRNEIRMKLHINAKVIRNIFGNTLNQKQQMKNQLMI